MQGVFVFVLLGLFAVMATLLVLLGAQMYRGTVDRSEANNKTRILYSYVRSMVRAKDASDCVSLENHGDVETVAMRSEIGEDQYVTWLYQYDGHLYEQFTHADREFNPVSGTAICAVNQFDPELTDSLLTLHMTDENDNDCTVCVALRAGAEE